MHSFTVTTTIAAPPERIWSIICDIEGSPKVVKEIERIHMLTDPPFRVGTRWQETRKTPIGHATAELEVVDLTPPTGYAVRSTLHANEFLCRFNISPQNAGATRLDLHMEMRPLNITGQFFAFFSPLIVGAMKSAMQQDLNHIKHAAEAH